MTWNMSIGPRMYLFLSTTVISWGGFFLRKLLELPKFPWKTDGGTCISLGSRQDIDDPSTSYFTMLLAVTQGLIALFICRSLWSVFRRRMANASLNNIPGPPSTSFLTGCVHQVFDLDGWAFHDYISKTYGGVIKFKAILGENQLIVSDPKALHYVLVKEQHIFEESPSSIAMSRLMFGEGVGAVLGDQHRKQRKMLNPVFSIAHMREMLLTFYDVSYKLRDSILRKVEDGPQEVDMMSWMTRTALELIGQSGLGYSFDSLTDGGQHPYCEAAKQLMPSLFKLIIWVIYFLVPLSKIGTPWFRRKLVDLLPYKDLHKVRDIIDVLHNTSVEIYESKKKALEDGDEALAAQVGRGKDIMSILMKANMSATDEESLTRDELLGQMTTLIFAAMDTTSSALSRILYLLAKHQDIQDKLRHEIAEAKEGGVDLSYDDLVSLPYLDAICRETMRLYPPVPMVNRTALADTIIPLSIPIRGMNGEEIRELAVPEGTVVQIGIMASNRNQDIWGPDADVWKPERWIEGLPESVAAAHLPGIYSHLLTFIGGGRACIGFKFSQLEMKAVLMTLIESFRFTLTKDEIFWQMAGITTPVVVGSSNIMPQLPLVVERIR